MNALPSPRSRQLGERVNKHNKPLLWIYSLGPSLPVRPQPPAQGLTHKHQSLSRLKKHRWKCVNSRFSFFCVGLLSKDMHPVVLMEKACGVRHTMTCTKNTLHTCTCCGSILYLISHLTLRVKLGCSAILFPD